MKRDTPNILLVNPWIHDFAAYDFWAKPIGLLTLASILRNHGFSITYLDCLDRFHPKMPKTNPYARYGRGPYLKNLIRKPQGLEDVTRNFSRYGIKPDWLKEDLLSIPRPDLVLITSHMTYWYPGVQETIKLVKKVFPKTPIVLGGIYASLCYDHADNHCAADMIVAGQGTNQIIKIAGKYTGFEVKPNFDPDDLDTYSYPAFDLQSQTAYIPLLTSIGCPFSCSYCASDFLNPKRMLKSPEYVLEEIQYWHKKYKIIDFVFYDDALLVDSDIHAVRIFEEIIKSGLKVRFHTPNAVHIRKISKQVAELMFKAGFATLRIGLETMAFKNKNRLDSKVTLSEFEDAVFCLKEAGFQKNQIGTYLLAGLPGQPISAVENSIKMVKQHDLTPILAYYTPIPHTALWSQAVESSRYDLEADPIYTNNSILPCQSQPFSWESIASLKKQQLL